MFAVSVNDVATTIILVCVKEFRPTNEIFYWKEEFPVTNLKYISYLLMDFNRNL